MNYYELKIFNSPALNDVLIAWLSEVGYDMFTEREGGLNAYISEKLFDEESLREIISGFPDNHNIRFEKTFIQDQNWNQEWEKNFQPVFIAGKVHVRAPFHAAADAPMEIIIEPKMSFGTGHHATTCLMMEQMLEMKLSGSKILDMGSGSGILAILAVKLGASEVHAVDNDDWAVANCKENCKSNKVPGVIVAKGNSAYLNEKMFDVILANINRNVILDDIQKYSTSLSKKGFLLVSGFLTEDRNQIKEAAEESGMKLLRKSEKNNWVSILFTRQ
ncbi:MAG: 50S ribosomal protein L11 methyltransferase [Bacteroidetes bacterium]|nr:MAG: 50S ribosomal protein L11 methyltransferase [Bacteroidota bacterium]